GTVQLAALMPRYRVVGVVVHREERRRDARQPEERRVLHVLVRRFPDRLADAALRLLVLERARDAGAPANASVGREHVDDRRAGHGGGEHLRLRDDEECLVATPRLTLEAQALRIDVAALEQFL